MEEKPQRRLQRTRSMLLDTASLAAARRFVQEYNENTYGKVYALLLNAEISGMHDGVTEDGMDIVFQTNHLGHFLLALAVSSANYYDRSLDTCPSSELSYNESNARELWESSKVLCGLD